MANSKNKSTKGNSTTKKGVKKKTNYNKKPNNKTSVKKNSNNKKVNNEKQTLDAKEISRLLAETKPKEVEKNNVVEKEIKKKKTKPKKKTVTKKEKLNTIESNSDYKKAEQLYKNKNYEEAYELYLEVLNEFKDKKIYKRLIECLTKDFTYKDKSREFNKEFNDYLVSYKILITKRELSILEKKLDEYKNVKPVRSKSKFILISTLGFLGVHKFIERKYLLGLVYLFTLGIFGIGVIYDLINDYVQYENDFQVDIVRYIISIGLIIVALLNMNSTNFFFLIIASILFMPIVYTRLLYLIPGIIKIIIFIVLVCLVFYKKTVVENIPTYLIGTWETTNENTNFVSIKVKNDKSTIKFNDRESETGLNEYNTETKIFKVYINATTYYRFIIDKDNKTLCIYNDSKTCNVGFDKKK